MKKVLLATTVLVGTAGFAAAEVSLSGDARMGITKGQAAADQAEFSSRARVSFSLSGETDGGLSFGASFRADNARSGALTATTPQTGADAGTAGSVFISGAFGKLAMGDVDSAAEAAVGQVSATSFAGLGDLNEIDYIGDGADATNGGVVLYTYSMDAFTLHVSANDVRGANRSSGVGVAYAGEGYGVSLGFEDGGADTKAYMGLSGSMGDVAGKLVVANQSSTTAANDGREYALSLTYTADALSVTAFYNRDDRPATAITASGVGVAYDLGGGAKVVGGVARDDNAANGTETAYDLGVSFSF